MKRKRRSPREREKILKEADYLCCLCGGLIDVKRWTLEHIKPLHMGGLDERSNLGPAHDVCAAKKTADEAPTRARADRRRRRHLGIKKPGRKLGWRKFDGTPVYADKER